MSITPHTRHRSHLIDVAVNNAGYALVGPFEDSSISDEIKAPFETNLSEPVRSYVMQAPTNPLSVFTKPQI